MTEQVIYKAECPVCGEVVEFENIEEKICPFCKGAKVKFDIMWEIIEDKEDD